jgi:hypothetical protein
VVGALRLGRIAAGSVLLGALLSGPVAALWIEATPPPPTCDDADVFARVGGGVRDRIRGDRVRVVGRIDRGPEVFGTISGTWLPIALVFLATCITGLTVSTMPWPRSADAGSKEPGKKPEAEAA